MAAKNQLTKTARLEGRYRYYTCSTMARQGATGCAGRTVPTHKLDTLVADHIERRLLQPARLEQILSSVLDRQKERRAPNVAYRRIAQARGRSGREAQAALRCDRERHRRRL